MSQLSPEQETTILDLMRAGKKIDAIKRHREITNDGLKEAKEAVEALAAKHNLQPPASAGCGSAAAALLIIGFAVAWTVSHRA